MAASASAHTGRSSSRATTVPDSEDRITRALARKDAGHEPMGRARADLRRALSSRRHNA